jgi:hypothetical protein
MDGHFDRNREVWTMTQLKKDGAYYQGLPSRPDQEPRHLPITRLDT